ncbi:MAG: hypothetical protein ACHWZW_04410 [Spirulina sp.]
MDSSTLAIRNTLDSFFSEKDLAVLVIRGSWGIGKTYFWENYVQNRIDKKELKQTAYSYISLFGLHDLSELKSKIFRTGKLLKSREQFKEELKSFSLNENRISEALFGARSGSQDFLRFLAPLYQFAKYVPQVKGFSSIIDLAEYQLISNYLICLDDIERKEESLKIRQIMGFVDELSKRKQCKVILILNEKTLSEQDLSEFNKYREKVIDLEVEYKPTIKENILKVFNSEDEYFESLLNVFQALDISNIRIFKKMKWSISKIWNFAKTCETSLQEEILVHLAVFCWGFFNSENNLSLSFISSSIKETTWLSLLSERENEQARTEEEKSWSQIASYLALFPSCYDDYLVSLLTDGYLNEEEFKKEVDKANYKKQIDITQQKLRDAWDIYADSFDDNLDQLKSTIRDILESDLSKISLWDFSQSIDLLEEYGDDVNSYIDKYVSLHANELANTDPEDFSSIRKIKNVILEFKIQELRDNSKILNINDVLDGIVKNQGWGREDINFLSSLTEDDIYEWMMSKPDRIVSKIRKGLLTFKGLSSNNEKESQDYKTIADITIAALIRVAKLNPLNRKRVKFIYRIEIPEEESL